jgi:hypothetical protein
MCFFSYVDFRGKKGQSVRGTIKDVENKSRRQEGTRKENGGWIWLFSCICMYGNVIMKHFSLYNKYMVLKHFYNYATLLMITNFISYVEKTDLIIIFVLYSCLGRNLLNESILQTDCFFLDNIQTKIQLINTPSMMIQWAMKLMLLGKWCMLLLKSIKFLFPSRILTSLLH